MSDLDKIISRLRRSTWDSRTLPSREDVRVVLHALERMSGIAAASLSEHLEHLGDSMDDYYAKRLEEAEAICAAFQGGDQ